MLSVVATPIVPVNVNTRSGIEVTATAASDLPSSSNAETGTATVPTSELTISETSTGSSTYINSTSTPLTTPDFSKTTVDVTMPTRASSSSDQVRSSSSASMSPCGLETAPDSTDQLTSPTDEFTSTPGQSQSSSELLSDVFTSQSGSASEMPEQSFSSSSAIDLIPAANGLTSVVSAISSNATSSESTATSASVVILSSSASDDISAVSSGSSISADSFSTPSSTSIPSTGFNVTRYVETPSSTSTSIEQATTSRLTSSTPFTPAAVPSICPTHDNTQYHNTHGSKYDIHCSASWNGNVTAVADIGSFELCLLKCDRYTADGCGAAVWDRVSTCYLNQGVAMGGFLETGTDNVGIKIQTRGSSTVVTAISSSCTSDALESLSTFSPMTAMGSAASTLSINTTSNASSFPPSLSSSSGPVCSSRAIAASSGSVSAPASRSGSHDSTTSCTMPIGGQTKTVAMSSGDQTSSSSNRDPMSSILASDSVWRSSVSSSSLGTGCTSNSRPASSSSATAPLPSPSASSSSGPPTSATSSSTTPSPTSTRSSSISSPGFADSFSTSPSGCSSSTSSTQLFSSTSSSPLSFVATTRARSRSSTMSVAPKVVFPSLTSSSATTSVYTFNRAAQTNLAVYWGASPATTNGGILTLCRNPNVDMVMIAFLGAYFGPNGYPSLKIGGNSCQAATTAQQATAPGLVDCLAMAPMITECQRIGKPILLSIGGSTSTSNFSSAAQATEFASTLWALFGADLTNTTTRPIRPFGTDVVLDGFDIDAENDMPDYYGTFASALRAKYATNTSKPYYLSGSPHCPIPDTSLPLDAMLQFDWVWPRFYNAMRCNMDSAGFLNSLSAWSRQLYINGTIGPRLFPGVAVSNLTSSGDVPGADLNNYISRINLTNMTNFGGLMLWDGSFALANDTNGIDYLTYAKRSLANAAIGTPSFSKRDHLQRILPRWFFK
ncbi:hypothetical protein AC579_6006 [Pseudocercospora musae]|uniref:chitinase n=1 Tax=Pseudocercospora musae TaxID=113226 RepID=A0A139H759_9PEZI|nr:hypothetical protein AC579_6006 [Pseudocercospora musae]